MSAQKDDRVNLATIRQGEYEGFEKKLHDPHWKPDFGPAKFDATAGATTATIFSLLLNSSKKPLKSSTCDLAS